MTINDVREYEKQMQTETNERLLQEMQQPKDSADGSTSSTPSGSKVTTPVTPTTPGGSKKGWFNWS